MADGSIVIAVDADDKEAQKTLSSLTKKIEALEKKISDKTAGRNQLVEQLKAANNEAIDTYNTVERLRKELAESQAKTSVSGPSIDPTQYAEELERQKAISNELKEQEAILAKKESIAERLVEKDSQTVADLERQNEELSRLKEQAGDVQRQMARASKGLSEMPETLNLANKQMNSFVTRIAGLAKRVFVFTLITKALRSLRSWLWSVIQTNSEAMAAMARLKGALLTLAQPLVDVVIPAFTAFVNVLAAVINKISQFIAFLTGKSVSSTAAAAKSLYDEMNAVEGVGSAAEDASKQLASFDEINKLSADTASGDGAGTTSSSTAVTPDFDVSGVTSGMEGILDIVEKIGAALLTWTLSKTFMSALEALTGLNIPANVKIGVSLIAAGAGLAAENIASILAGEYNATSLRSAISEAVSGLMIGAGLTLLGVGVWAFPVAIALVVSITEIVVNWPSIKSMWGSIIDGIKALFSGDSDTFWEDISQAYLTWMGMDAWGVKLAEKLVNAIFGEGTWDKMKAYLENGGTFEPLFEWLAEKFGGVQEFFGSIGQWFSDTFSGIGSAIGGVWSAITGFFESVGQWFSDLFSGICETASGAWESIKEFFAPAVEWFSEVFGSIKETVDDVFYNIGVIVNGCWEIIQAVWELVSGWFDENVIQPVGGFFSSLWNAISGAASDAWETIKGVFSTITGWIDKNIIQPVGGFFSDLWDGFSQKASEAWDAIKNVFNTVGDFFRDIFSEAWQKVIGVFSTAGEIFVDIKDGVISGFKWIVNKLIDGINKVVSIPFGGINDALTAVKNVNILGLTPFSGIKMISIPQIPHLAQGAVIPPNREFMAVLGDQKSGTNIETPLATMVQAFKQAMAESGYTGRTEAVLMLDKTELGRVVYKLNKAESNRVGVSLMGV